MLKESGIDLKVVEFNDYIQPNLALMQGKLDANFFQHQAYLNDFNKSRNANLLVLANVHIEPMGLYFSDNKLLNKFIKTKDRKFFLSNLKIGIPNDVTNEGRALKLLELNNLIAIKKNVLYPTKKDITENPYKLDIVELDASMLARLIKLNQLNLAVINANFAILSGLNPLTDTIFIESINKNNYVNVVAIMSDRKNDKKLLILKQIINNVKTKKFIYDKYKGAVIPAF
jgi:D-methionine transport system substrate-binding protein